MRLSQIPWAVDRTKERDSFFARCQRLGQLTAAKTQQTVPYVQPACLRRDVPLHDGQSLLQRILRGRKIAAVVQRDRQLAIEAGLPAGLEERRALHQLQRLPIAMHSIIRATDGGLHAGLAFDGLHLPE